MNGERRNGPALRGRDPAASMSLLTRLLANPLDAGYTDYSEQATGARKLWQRLLVFLFALALGLASVSAVASLRAASAHDVAGGLRDRAQSKQASVAALEDEVLSLSKTIDSAAGAQGAAASLSQGLVVANALSPVTGPGLVVSLTDSASAAALARGGGAVRDLDLNVVVNALWGAGAEAISVNGIRIGPGTFIRTAGASILVNITPVRSPYELRAIGDANALSVALVRGRTGDFLSSSRSVNGIEISAAADSSLELPALDLRQTRSAAVLDPSQGE